MVYLDYAATTPVNEEVLDTFVEATRKYTGNPNSIHKLGVLSKDGIEDATNTIANLLGVKSDEIIYTSGASESNNLAIKGVALREGHGHIITTMLEHSSITAPLNYLQAKGFEVEFVELLPNGQVDLNHLKSLIKENTILVTICAVDSELGIRQPIEEIGALLKEYPGVTFHVDATQCVGKTPVDLKDVDLVSFSAHKIYGIKGIGGLIKKEGIMIEPMIHGGKSTTIFRSGTPTGSLIVSTAKAFELAFHDLDNKIERIKELNRRVKEFLSKYDTIVMNSTEYSIPNTINFSILNVDSEQMLLKLSDKDIFISNKSACSANSKMSIAVRSVTKDDKRALTSLRVSLSHLTTREELDYFFEQFDLCYKELSGGQL